MSSRLRNVMFSSHEDKCIVVNGCIKLVWGKGVYFDYGWLFIYKWSNNEWVELHRLESDCERGSSFHVNGVTIYMGPKNTLAVVQLINKHYKIITYRCGETTPRYGVSFKHQDDDFMAYYDKYSKMFDNLLRLTSK